MAAATRTDKAGGTYLHKWSLTTADPTGDAIEFPGATDRTIQILGTFGGATIVWEGSLDGGTTYATMHDIAGVALSYTAAAIGAVAENALLIRPRLSVVGVGAAIDSYLLSKGTL